MKNCLKLILYFSSEFLGLIIIGCICALTIIAVHNGSQEKFCDFAIEKGFYDNTVEDKLLCSTDYLEYILGLIKGSDKNE